MRLRFLSLTALTSLPAQLEVLSHRESVDEWARRERANGNTEMLLVHGSSVLFF